jgi:hypothetical protein
MIDYKFYSTDQSHPPQNINLLSSILPQDRLIKDIREAYDYKGALIHIDSNLFTSKNISKEIFDFREEKNKQTLLLVDYSYETGCAENDFNNKITQIAKLGIDPSKVLYVFNRSAYHDWMDKHINQITFIDLFAVSAAIRHAIYKLPASQTTVKNRPKKINLLLGKINKPSRMQVLKSFYNSTAREKTLFSILGMPTEKQEDKKFLEFLKNNQGPVDGVEIIDTNEGISSQGWPDNCQVYDETSVSFICETHETNDSLFVTEKTYRPILNRHPFIVRASFPLLDYLKAIGFQTFNEFVDESYDDTHDTSKEHIDSLVKNAEKLLDELLKSPDRIQEIVDHNYKILIKFAQNELAVLNQRIFALLK